MRWPRLIALALASSALLGARGAADPGDPDEIAVVVGATSPVHDVTLDTLRDLYLRRQRLWPSGDRALPVNLPADDPVRQTFSTRVLGRSPRELVGYWNRRYFEGIRPPLVLPSARAICAYLASEPGAVAYLPSAAVDPDDCRVVRVIADAE